MSEGDGRAALMFLPLALASSGLICSILGIGAVRAMSTRQASTVQDDRNNHSFMAVAYFLVEIIDDDKYLVLGFIRSCWWHWCRAINRVLHRIKAGR